MIATRLLQSQEWKDKGNAFFKDKKYKKAIVNYQTVFSFLNGLPGPEDGENGMNQYANALGKERATVEENQRINEIKSITYTNIAACYEKLNDPDQTLTFATKAVQCNAAYAKAHLRLGQAYMAQRDLDASQKSLEHALTLLTSSATSTASIKKAILASLQQLKGLQKQQREREKQKFQGMFTKLGGSGLYAESK